jgi:hypothetical protein
MNLNKRWALARKRIYRVCEVEESRGTLLPAIGGAIIGGRINVFSKSLRDIPGPRELQSQEQNTPANTVFILQRFVVSFVFSVQLTSIVPDSAQ